MATDKGKPLAIDQHLHLVDGDVCFLGSVNLYSLEGNAAEQR
jgi:hypothetical protein